MKTALPVLLALGGACAVCAGSPGTASADVVAMKGIPVTKIPSSMDMPQAQAPDHIAASEKVEGFYPANPPVEWMKRIKEHGGYKYVEMFTTEAEARAYSLAGSSGSSDQTGPRACLTTGWNHSDRLYFTTYIAPPPPKPGSKEWVADQKRKAQQGFKPGAKATPPSKPNTVRAVRSERFVPGSNDAATLEITDAWFDYTELGVRVASHASVPFTKVATGPNGLSIYAARDDKQVTFIVTPPKAPEQEGPNPEAMRNVANRLVAQLSSNSGTSSSECGYLRLSLQTGPGTGQMASVLATAFLPPAAEDAADLPSTAVDEEDQQRAQEQRKRIVRIRPMMANVSISQLASEPDPLVSISFAWAGHDSQQRF
jgi:hypothetical protein